MWKPNLYRDHIQIYKWNNTTTISSTIFATRQLLDKEANVNGELSIPLFTVLFELDVKEGYFPFEPKNINLLIENTVHQSIFRLHRRNNCVTWHRNRNMGSCDNENSAKCMLTIVSLICMAYYGLTMWIYYNTFQTKSEVVIVYIILFVLAASFLQFVLFKM